MRDQIERMVMDWARCADDDADIIVCLSAGESFRYWVWPDYKRNRANREEPAMLQTAFEILKHDYYTWAVEGLEGDDCLGIMATSDPENSIIVTIDKDLLQVPGFHANPDKGDKEAYTIGPIAAAWNFHVQWLMGDTTDHLPGLPGVGIKRAIKILGDTRNPDKMRERVQQEYADRGKSETYCRQMERCIRVLTRKDWA